MKNKINAVIFDFNGTLFFDTEFHNEAWQNFAQNHNVFLTKEDLSKNIHGHTNSEILHYLFKTELNKEQLNRYYEEKEDLYRNICRSKPDDCILAPGAIDFLNYLKEKNIKRTIATASYPKNILFYNDIFGLDQWFSIEQIIHDNGKFKGKPDPGMFIAAAKILDVPTQECMIIEDSIMGILAANNANAGKIIAMSSDNQKNKFDDYSYIDQIITDFRTIDRSCFSI
jgi:beta-phosphoglucomutase